MTDTATRRVGWRAGLAGAVGLGAVAAGGVARNMTRRRTDGSVDPFAGVDFTTIYDDEATTVTTDDGLALAVRTVTTGPAEAEPELTVVFVHGFSLRMAAWHFQRYQLPNTGRTAASEWSSSITVDTVAATTHPWTRAPSVNSPTTSPPSSVRSRPPDPLCWPDIRWAAWR